MFPNQVNFNNIVRKHIMLSIASRSPVNVIRKHGRLDSSKGGKPFDLQVLGNCVAAA